MRGGARSSQRVRASEGRAGRRRLGPTGRTITLCALGLLAGVTQLVVVHVSSQAADEAAHRLEERVLPADVALHQASLAAARSQQAVLAAAQAQDQSARAALTIDAVEAGRELEGAWSTYLQHAMGQRDEEALQRSFESSAERLQALGVQAISIGPSDPRYASTLADEQQEAMNRQEVLARLEDRYAPVVKRDGRTVRTGVARTRRATVASYGVLALIFSGVGLVLLRGASRDQRLLVTEAAEMRLSAQRADLESSLQRGLEMEGTEQGTYAVVDKALRLVAPNVEREMLLADSSQAHFRRVVSGDEGSHGCGATTPLECPATATGVARTFDDSRALDTCPLLRGLDGPVSAACVPVSVAGRPTGVIHMQQPLEAGPLPDLTREVELVARKAGERIGVLRVLARSEAQARVDPLTGLPNRRTLEDQVHMLLANGRRFVVAFADVDRFKAINDRHGHEVGDRALRLFARVLRDAVRPGDLLARYGGEEFVLVLPECSLADAKVVGERVRMLLAGVLAQATVPTFTVTIGLASADPDEPFFEVVARADAAMLRGKSAGRDRVVVDELPPDAPVD